MTHYFTNPANAYIIGVLTNTYGLLAMASTPNRSLYTFIE
jgi:hypothetical protein